MSRKVPNIALDSTLKLRDRESFKNFVLTVIADTFTYSYNPDILDVVDSVYFTLTLVNKKFIFDILQVDDVTDYIDIYLFGVKQPKDRYSVQVGGDNIIVTFVADITRLPNEVTAQNFEIKGKIVDIV